jgi:hypothetical protein
MSRPKQRQLARLDRPFQFGHEQGGFIHVIDVHFHPVAAHHQPEVHPLVVGQGHRGAVSFAVVELPGVNAAHYRHVLNRIGVARLVRTNVKPLAVLFVLHAEGNADPAPVGRKRRIVFNDPVRETDLLQGGVGAP